MKKIQYINSDQEDREIPVTGKNRHTERICSLLDLPDLTRKEGSPVKFVTDAILSVPALEAADIATIPEIVTVRRNFDLLGAPKDHPSRSPGDTFYLDDTHILRPQTTVMWTYYLEDTAVRNRIKKGESVMALCHGKVYRRDEIDRGHYPVFHQIDGLSLRIGERIDDESVGKELDEILLAIAKSIFGSAYEMRITPDSFPFTVKSRQLEVFWNGNWFELLGAGLVNPAVIAGFGLDPNNVTGWAFGFGLDRLAMVRMGIPDIRILWSTDERITRQFVSLESSYTEVSRYPHTDRDVSFIVGNEIPLNMLYEAMRDSARMNSEECIEEVKVLDRYENESKFGADKVSYLFRVRYRSNSRTLTTEEVNEMQERLRLSLVDEFSALLR